MRATASSARILSFTGTVPKNLQGRQNLLSPVDNPGAQGKGDLQALLGLRLVSKPQVPEHPPSLLVPQNLPSILRCHIRVCDT